MRKMLSFLVVVYRLMEVELPHRHVGIWFCGRMPCHRPYLDAGERGRERERERESATFPKRVVSVVAERAKKRRATTTDTPSLSHLDSGPLCLIIDHGNSPPFPH